MKSVGQVIFAFFEDYLKTQKGLRPGSIRSYRDTLKLFLAYVASNCRRPITRLILSDLSAQRVLDFLHMIEVTRGNHVSTRNQRLAALHTFYRYVGLQYPELLAEAQRVEAIPTKRTAPPQTDYLEHDEIEALFKSLPRHGILSLRDRAIFMVLYNTGARVQEMRIADVDLDGPLRRLFARYFGSWCVCTFQFDTISVQWFDFRSMNSVQVPGAVVLPLMTSGTSVLSCVVTFAPAPDGRPAVQSFPVVGAGAPEIASVLDRLTRRDLDPLAARVYGVDDARDLLVSEALTRRLAQGHSAIAVF